MLCATHHDAFYLECADEDAGRGTNALASCFLDATGVVLAGGQLRLDVGIVRCPNHYEDEDGKEIWNIVMRFPSDRETSRVDKAEELRL
jgi:hypothetical protein